MNWVGSLEIDKCLAKLIKKQRERTQINKISFFRNEKEVKINSTEIQRTLRVYWRQLYDKMEKLSDMNKFLVVYNPSKLNHKERKYEQVHFQ